MNIIVFFFFSWNLQFIQSEFKGQLPKPYSSDKGATKIIHSDFNDMNKEETSRYVSVTVITDSSFHAKGNNSNTIILVCFLIFDRENNKIFFLKLK